MSESTHLATVLEEIADAIPEAPALIHGNEVRSWAEMDDRAARLAAALAAAGIRAQAKVAIYMLNASEYLEAFHASLKIRAIPVNVNYRYRGEELVYLLDDCDAEVVVVHDVFVDRLVQILPRLPKVRVIIQVGRDGRDLVDGAVGYESAIAQHDPHARMERSDDDVYLLYTGGTTGYPKGVMARVAQRTAGSLASRSISLGIDLPATLPPADYAVRASAAGQQSLALPVSPLMHATGLSFVSLTSLIAGGGVVTLQQRPFDPQEVLEVVERRRVTVLGVVGDANAVPILRALEERRAAGRPADMSSLRSVLSAGVAWTDAVKLAMFEHMPEVILAEGVGSSECQWGMRRSRHGEELRTSNFDPFPGLRMLDDDDRLTAPVPGATARIAVPTDVAGYYKDATKTATTFREHEGTLFAVPGDYVTFEPDGTVTLVGRGSGCINTGGEKVFPEEVEAVLKATGEIDDAVVLGIPDPVLGQSVAALVTPTVPSDFDAATVLSRVRQEVAGYKVPTRLVAVPTIPRHDNGKIDLLRSKELMDRELEAASAGDRELGSAKTLPGERTSEA